MIERHLAHTEDAELEEIRAQLLGSLLLFTREMYFHRTGREFYISEPIGRESHFVTISREFTKLQRLETQRLLINVAPGSGKSELCKHFIAWCLARYPDSKFLYISYGQPLAAQHTSDIKRIIELPQYKKLFGVSINPNFSARDNFQTNFGGGVRAFGSGGSITGQDAGLPNLDRFSGGIIIDDAHKPDEVNSDTMRQTVIDNYQRTLKPRKRGHNVFIAFIGQRLHEDDLGSFLINGKDGYDWRKVILKSIDEAGNILYPSVHSREFLEIEREFNPLTFSAQYQQDPQPSGGTIFRRDDFLILEEEPKILATFITCDSAETAKMQNDATVFSFWGLYNASYKGVDIGIQALHWLGCREIRVEPRDLEDEFMDFYAACMRHPVKPSLALIEKKSTGVTLLSTLKNLQGLRIIDAQEKDEKGKLVVKDKITRFREASVICAKKQITFPAGAPHTEMCLRHLEKITGNNAHKHDDIADTLAYAIRAAFFDKIIGSQVAFKTTDESKANEIMGQFIALQSLRAQTYGSR
jgi:hypothetical protein